MNAEQLKQLEDDLWSAADNLRANSDLKSSEYATPVLGLIFLKFADNKYKRAEPDITKEFAELRGTRREKPISEIAIQKCGFYLPDHARYHYLLGLPEQEDLARKIKQAMEAIEEYKTELDGILPKDEYFALTRTSNTLLAELLKNFSNIPADANGDIFGKIYEFFLGKFALSEGQKGGEFFTPTSVVKLMVEIIEPHHGTVYDPACGSAGMFVQSQQFVERHRKKLDELGEAHDEDQLYVYGQEKTLDTVKLAKMNLAVNGLRGEIRQANSYTENPFDGFGKFDFVMANPPFNVDDVPLASVEDDPRFNTYGLPRKKTKAKASEKGKETVPNANYLWINLFATSLKNNTPASGRAALVMANSASDARHSEADIRQTLIENNLIYGMLTLPSNMFYTVTLPATLWFFDKNKQDDRILFIDARNIFTQIDRAHREFSEEQVQNIAIISKLHKGKRADFIRLVDSYFRKGMEQLLANREKVEPVSEQLLDVLDDAQGKQAVGELVSQWQGLNALQRASDAYIQAADLQLTTPEAIETANRKQQQLRATFDPFFQQLHTGLKQLDKVVRQHEKARAEEARQAGKRATSDRNARRLKEALEELHKEVRSAEAYYQHIHWLQERFPNAEYEDVTGLCKLATPEEVKEQDYSLNPGRYVGVVIEEDGKTEEEFLTGIEDLNDELTSLDSEAEVLASLIRKNVSALVDSK
ncbi:N-6 DNA methylase [Marinobacter sp. LQ44]|uniref:N-6 DNA methylase n=1 Tax=unclassified Marinobacter TaxID=83889 RepID=UPI000718C150|nr:N-6 DNA methylase [Marinobacter sp. LQ44]AMQ88992.1 N-6 DNA methylase [Marinobacter sp. LQ44]